MMNISLGLVAVPPLPDDILTETIAKQHEQIVALLNEITYQEQQIESLKREAGEAKVTLEGVTIRTSDHASYHDISIVDARRRGR